jgi:hypothetical protein
LKKIYQKIIIHTDRYMLILWNTQRNTVGKRGVMNVFS